MHSAYPHRHHQKRIGWAEAMMEQPAECRQLDLLVLATSASQHQRLDPMIRAEVTGLLKLLIDECSAALAKAKEATDE
jgi:hypothetical protein